MDGELAGTSEEEEKEKKSSQGVERVKMERDLRKRVGFRLS